MKETIVILIALLIISCDKKTIGPIDFDSRDYKFNSEITQTLQQSKEVGFSATRFSFVSEHSALLEILETGDTIKSPLQDSIWAKIENTFNQQNAREYILKKAREHEIIMFNENHYLPKHRNFVKSVLPQLYDQGYRFLALEAIGMLGDGTMYDKELIKRGYPIKHTGHYIKEPEFSMLIRRAIELGFYIIGYDEGSGFGYSGGEREERGAENIINQISEIGKEGKLVVLCGWDHLKEGHSGSYWEHALAERLKQKTKNDPLTINQTEYNERLNLEFEKPLMQKLNHNESIVLVDKEENSIDLTDNSEWYDVFVFHPRTSFKHDIPNWVLEEGPTKKIDLTHVKLEGPFKVFVFNKKDNVKIASPLFVRELKSTKDKLVIPTRGTEIKLVLTNKKESLMIE